MTIKLICSDCNGVLNNVDGDYSKSGWYSTIAVDDAELYAKINKFLFSKKYLISSWMSGEIGYRDINKIVASNFDVRYDYLNEKLIESAKKLELNWDLIRTFQNFRKGGGRVVITSDNMDIFTLYTVAANNLNDYFDGIYNSSDIGHLKDFDNFQLYRNLAEENGVSFAEVLVVDDSRRIINGVMELGFAGYLYNLDTCRKFGAEGV